MFSHVLLVSIHVLKPGKQVSTLKAYAIMRLSSFTYRIAMQDRENLSVLQMLTYIVVRQLHDCMNIVFKLPKRETAVRVFFIYFQILFFIFTSVSYIGFITFS